MLHVSQLIGFGIARDRGNVSVINKETSFTEDGNFETTYTFSGRPVGTASSTRKVIAFIAASNQSAASRTLSSVTIGGVSASIDTNGVYNASGGSIIAAIVSATVPTGTTADVVVNFSGSMNGCAVSLVAIDGLRSNTPLSTGTDSDTTGTTLTTNVNIKEGGYVAALAACYNTTTYSWSASVTEVYDATHDGTVGVSMADAIPTQENSAAEITATLAASMTRCALAAASYL